MNLAHTTAKPQDTKKYTQKTQKKDKGKVNKLSIGYRHFDVTDPIGKHNSTICDKSTEKGWGDGPLLRPNVLLKR